MFSSLVFFFFALSYKDEKLFKAVLPSSLAWIRCRMISHFICGTIKTLLNNLFLKKKGLNKTYFCYEQSCLENTGIKTSNYVAGVVDYPIFKI